MSAMFRSTADLFADLNRMQSMLDRVFPSPGGSIRSQAGAGFPVPEPLVMCFDEVTVGLQFSMAQVQDFPLCAHGF